MKLVLSLLFILSFTCLAQSREHLRLISISEQEVKDILRDNRIEDCVQAFNIEEPKNIQVKKKTIEDDFMTNTYYQFLSDTYNSSSNNFNKKLEMIIHITEITDRRDAESIRCSVSK